MAHVRYSRAIRVESAMSQSPKSRLEHLKELVDAGLMSPEEYEASRRAIINETTGTGAAPAQPAMLGGHTIVGGVASLSGTPSSAGALAGGTQVLGPDG